VSIAKKQNAASAAFFNLKISRRDGIAWMQFVFLPELQRKVDSDLHTPERS